MDAMCHDSWHVRGTNPQQEGALWPPSPAGLATVRADIARSTWQPPTRQPDRVPTLSEYAEAWLLDRSRELKPRTTALYRGLLSGHLYPTLGGMQLDQISPAAVRAWHFRLDTGPTRRAHAYSLLRTILNTAVADDVITANPCRLRGAWQSRRVKDIRPATLDELAKLAEEMPSRLAVIVLLAAWCGLRFGEPTPGAALRYQHAAAGRDAQIAIALSRIANGGGQS